MNRFLLKEKIILWPYSNDPALREPGRTRGVWSLSRFCPIRGSFSVLQPPGDSLRPSGPKLESRLLMVGSLNGGSFCISWRNDVLIQDSLDLDMGRCPQLKSEELFEVLRSSQFRSFMRYQAVKTYSKKKKRCTYCIRSFTHIVYTLYRI